MEHVEVIEKGTVTGQHKDCQKDDGSRVAVPAGAYECKTPPLVSFGDGP
jgi:hypothetical protein